MGGVFASSPAAVVPPGDYGGGFDGVLTMAADLALPLKANVKHYSTLTIEDGWKLRIAATERVGLIHVSGDLTIGAGSEILHDRLVSGAAAVVSAVGDTSGKGGGCPGTLIIRAKRILGTGKIICNGEAGGNAVVSATNGDGNGGTGLQPDATGAIRIGAGVVLTYANGSTPTQGINNGAAGVGGSRPTYGADQQDYYERWIRDPVGGLIGSRPQSSVANWGRWLTGDVNTDYWAMAGLGGQSGGIGAGINTDVFKPNSAPGGAGGAGGLGFNFKRGGAGMDGQAQAANTIVAPFTSQGGSGGGGGGAGGLLIVICEEIASTITLEAKGGNGGSGSAGHGTGALVMGGKGGGGPGGIIYFRSMKRTAPAFSVAGGTPGAAGNGAGEAGDDGLLFNNG